MGDSPFARKKRDRAVSLDHLCVCTGTLLSCPFLRGMRIHEKLMLLFPVPSRTEASSKTTSRGDIRCGTAFHDHPSRGWIMDNFSFSKRMHSHSLFWLSAAGSSYSCLRRHSSLNQRGGAPSKTNSQRREMLLSYRLPR